MREPSVKRRHIPPRLKVAVENAFKGMALEIAQTKTIMESRREIQERLVCQVVQDYIAQRFGIAYMRYGDDEAFRESIDYLADTFGVPRG